MIIYLSRKILYKSNTLIFFKRYRTETNFRTYLTAKLRRQGYRYFKLRKAFSIFYRRHSALHYENIKKSSPPKIENFQMKNSDIFHISAQNIDCGYSLEPPRRGDSNEHPQSMFLNRNKKIIIPLLTPGLLYNSGV